MNINNRFFQLIVLRVLLFVVSIYFFFFYSGAFATILTSTFCLLFLSSFFIEKKELEQGWKVIIKRVIKENWFVFLVAVAFLSLAKKALLYYAILTLEDFLIKLVFLTSVTMFLYEYFQKEEDKVIRLLKAIVLSIVLTPFVYFMLFEIIVFVQQVFRIVFYSIYNAIVTKEL